MLDLSKPVQTRDGREARFIQILDRMNGPMLLVVYKNEEGHDDFGMRYMNGRLLDYKQSGGDIINVPQKHRFWVNFYRDGTLTAFLWREDADVPMCRENRLACIKVEFEEGQGL